MPKRYLGNIITDTPTAPAGPYETSAASGVWSLAEANAYTAAGLWPIPGNVNPRAVFYGQTSPSLAIEYVQINTLGNASDFGDSALSQYTPVGGIASSTRGILAGGANSSSVGFRDTIHYVTISTTGNATAFGDLTTNARFAAGGSNQTRGVRLAGETSSGTVTNVIDYITIASTGNATDFGDTTVAAYGTTGVSSPTRIVRAGYITSGNAMDYITTATTGNATDFGDLTTSSPAGSAAGCSSDTRGLFGGIYSANQDKIEYITIATTGNSTTFGDLGTQQYAKGAASSNTRGLFAGGTQNQDIEFVTIATTGNAVGFGNLSALQIGNSGFSNAHGGLQ